LDDELALDYLADCRENLSVMETEILAIGMGGGAEEDGRLDRVFRAAHAIGGPAVYFGLTRIHELAYRIENLVALIRSRQLASTKEQADALLAATDRLRELISDPQNSNLAEIAAVSADLDRLRQGQSTTVDLAPSVLSATSSASIDELAPTTVQIISRPLRILLVEDDFACRLLLQTFLSRYGQCHIAVNGEEAVDAFRIALDCGQPYDLICMDIMMPVMDGREAVRQVRALEESQGILSTFGARIFMTTTVQEIKEVFLCFKELCDAYLMKPLDLGQLLDQMKFFRLLDTRSISE